MAKKSKKRQTSQQEKLSESPSTRRLAPKSSGRSRPPSSSAQRPAPNRPKSRRAPLTRPAAPADLRWILWVLVSLTVFANVPLMMSGNYLPKTFWAALTVAIGFLFWHPSKSPRIEITALGLVWLAYMAWALLSLIWAPQPRVGFERWLALLLPTLAYLLARRTQFWKSDTFWIFFTLIIAAVSLIGILQYSFSNFPYIHNFTGTAIPRSTLGQRNYASMYLLLALPFVAWQYFRAQGPRSALTFACLIMGLGFILVAKTRGAWVGFAMAWIFLTAGGVWPKALLTKGKILALIIALILSIFVVNWINPSKQFNAQGVAFKNSFQSTLMSFTTMKGQESRLEMWDETMSTWRISLTKINPFLGGGFGNFPIHATSSSIRNQVKSLDWEVHNDYLQAFIDLGIPGFALFSLMIGMLVLLAWRGRKSGLILAAGASIVGLAVMQFTTFTSEKVSSLILIASVAAILNSQARVRPILSVRAPKLLLMAGNYLLALYLFVFCVIVYFTIVGDREFKKEQFTLNTLIQKIKLGQIPETLKPQYLKKAKEKMAHLCDEVLPTMQFNANIRHIYCNQLVNTARKLQDNEHMLSFAQAAIRLHPADRSSMQWIAEIALIEKRHADAEAAYEHIIEVFGYNPYQTGYVGPLQKQSCAETLAALYDFFKKPEKAKELREKIKANTISAPAAAVPQNLTRDVPLEPHLDWADSNAALRYNLYFWKVGEQKPEKPTLSRLKKSEAQLSKPFEPGATYLWQITAVGRYGEETGEIWAFRTIRETN